MPIAGPTGPGYLISSPGSFARHLVAAAPTLDRIGIRQTPERPSARRFAFRRLIAYVGLRLVEFFAYEIAVNRPE